MTKEELKEQDIRLNKLCFEYQEKDKRIAELKKENAELKTRVENQKFFLKRIRAKFELGKIDKKEIEGYLESENLTKAKEIIKKFSEFVNNDIEYDPEHPQEHTDLWNKLCEEAEQFLSEVEK